VCGCSNILFVFDLPVHCLCLSVSVQPSTLSRKSFLQGPTDAKGRESYSDLSEKRTDWTGMVQGQRTRGFVGPSEVACRREVRWDRHMTSIPCIQATSTRQKKDRFVEKILRGVGRTTGLTSRSRLLVRPTVNCCAPLGCTSTDSSTNAEGRLASERSGSFRSLRLPRKDQGRVPQTLVGVHRKRLHQS
jgi:hypothetical protein